MLSGGLITLLTPFQLVAVLRRRWPGLHRMSGRLLVIAGLLTAICGLTFVGGRGTIGGTVMDVGFTLYGTLLGLAAVQTYRSAHRREFDRHRTWALRFFCLAIASWLYRVHYGLWYFVTGGLWSEPDFSGGFDKVQVFAFYLPYLLLLEVYLRREPLRL